MARSKRRGKPQTAPATDRPASIPVAAPPSPQPDRPQPAPPSQQTEPGEPAADTLRARLARRMATVDRAVVSASALVALIGAVLGLLFVFWPDLRPDEPPPAMGAELDEAKLEPNVALGDFLARREAELQRQAPETRQFTPAELARAGAILTFQAVIEGYQGERCSVRWSLFDAGTGQRLAGLENLVDQDGWPTKHITPTVTRDQVDAELWVPLPREPGPFFARVELLDPGGVRLASLDSPAFAGAPEPEPTPTSPPSATSAPPVLTPPVFGR